LVKFPIENVESNVCEGQGNFEKIASVKSSKEAWDILEKAYNGMIG